MFPTKIKKPRNKNFKLKLNLSWKNLIIYAFLILFTGFLFMGIAAPSGNSTQTTKTVPLSQLIADVKQGKVSSIEVSSNKIDATEKSGIVEASKESTADVYQLFQNAGVKLDKTKVNIKDDTALNSWINILSGVLPILLMVGFFYFIFRQARGAQESVFSFGQSKAKVFNKDKPKITFKDVAGVDEAKQE